jgi:hypothetical protein
MEALVVELAEEGYQAAYRQGGVFTGPWLRWWTRSRRKIWISPTAKQWAWTGSMVKFKGRCKDLELNVYDYLTPSQVAKDYKTTTKEFG